MIQQASLNNKGVPRRPGMTLIELMVAVALSAMLLAALLGVLSGITKQCKLAETYDKPVWPARFVALLRRDLIAAERIWTSKNTIWFETDAPAYLPYTKDGDTSTGGIRRIGYRCRSIPNKEGVLMRQDGDHSEAIAIGPDRIVVERLDSDGVPQPLPPMPGPVPSQVRVWVWEADKTSPSLVRDLVIR